MAFRLLPVPGEPGTRADERIVPDLTWIRRTWPVDLRDAYAATGHKAGGEHPLGLGVDIWPDFRRGGTWDDVDRLAAFAAKRRDVFRWIGYDGRFGTDADPNHGRGNHLHLSWRHTNTVLGGAGTVPRLRSGPGTPGSNIKRNLGTFESTSYGPPWGGIQGTGVTANGTDLRSGRQVYGVAVDPGVIPLGSHLYITPNPFNHPGTFVAFDTGGAIDGKRIDFYDWRGRKKQNGWGRRTVTVQLARRKSNTGPDAATGVVRPGGDDPASDTGNPDTVLASWFGGPNIITPGSIPGANEAGNAAKDAAGAVKSAVDFFKWIAWIFHPRNILRVVEFMIGFPLIGVGIWILVQQWRDADSQAPMRMLGDAVSMTGPGRALRVAKGKRVGKGLARSDARRRETAKAVKSGRSKEIQRQGEKRLRRESRKDKEDIPF